MATTPTVRATGAVAVNTGDNLTVTLPTHATGDLLIVVAGGSGIASASPTHSLSGWTQVGTITDVANTIRGVATVWALRATSGAMSNPVVVGSPSNATNHHYAARALSITAGTWNDTGTLSQAWEDVTTGTAKAASGNVSVSVTGFATVGTQRLCIAHCFEADNIGTGITNGASYVTLGTDSDSATGCDGYLGTRSLSAPSTGGGGTSFSFTAGGTGTAPNNPPCFVVVFGLLPGPTVYTETGTVAAAAAVAATDAVTLVLTETGTVAAAAAVAATDAVALAFPETGTVAADGAVEATDTFIVGGGSDYTETGAVDAAAAVAGAEAQVDVEAGTAAPAASVAGAETLALTEAGTVGVAGSVASSDSRLLVEAGSAGVDAAVAEASAATLVDVGAVAASAYCAGVDLSSGTLPPVVVDQWRLARTRTGTFVPWWRRRNAGQTR